MTSKPAKYDINKVLSFLSIFLLFLIFFLIFLRKPVENSDFWWHLATGKYIVQTGSIPDHDPFAYTTDNSSIKKPMVLRGNWLSQVIFYGTYRNWKETGIIVLRSLLLMVFVFFSFLTVKRKKIPLPLVIGFTIAIFFTARMFAGERPQLFTFAIFSATLFICEEFRRSSSKSVLLLPVLVGIAANMHPGYIVCLLIITCYLLGELFDHFLRGRRKTRTVKIIFVSWVLSVGFSLINPNAILPLLKIFSIHGDSIEGITEFMPTFYVYRNKLESINVYHISFLFLSLMIIRYFRKMDAAHIMLLVGFTYMSIFALRYIIFYMCVAAPILAEIMSNAFQEERVKRIIERVSISEAFINVSIVVLMSVLFINTVSKVRAYSFRVDTLASTPKGAADFLENVGIKGNMFNEYGFGGYLLWRLYPRNKVFIDGRQLERSVFEEYKNVVGFLSNGPVTWSSILEKYNVTYIVATPIFHYGTILPLVEHLYDSDEWSLVYLDQLALIFVKRGTGNEKVISMYEIEKAEALNTIIVQASVQALRNKVNPYYLITIGKAFYKMEKFDEAEKAFHMADERDPGNDDAAFWLEKIRVEKSGTNQTW